MQVEAHVNGTVISRTAILRAIENEGKKEYDEEHLSLSDYEIEHVKGVIGDYALLPEDSDTPLKEQTWEGTVLLIPPRSDVFPYVLHLRERFDFISEAIVVVPIDVIGRWFSNLASMSNAVFYKTRVIVKAMDSEDEVNTKDSYAFFYIGKNAGDFLEAYKLDGWGHTINKVVTGSIPMRLKK